MKIRSLFVTLCITAIFIFAGCSGGYKFNYEDMEIESITILTLQAGNNKEDNVASEKWNELINDLNGLKYKSYSGSIKGISDYQVLIKFSTGDEEIIDSNRIRRTEKKPMKYRCTEADFNKVIEKYIVPPETD